MTEKYYPKVGDKIRYKHGKGLSTGEILEISPSHVATVKTKNGAKVLRPTKRLKPLES